MSTSSFESTRDSSFDDEVDSSVCNDESTTTDEELLIEELLRTTTKNRSSEQMMTTEQIAGMLVKVRVGESFVYPSTTVSVISSQTNMKGADDKNTPQTVLNDILEQNGYKCDKIVFDRIPKDFFLSMTDDNIKAYTKETLGAVRTKNVEKLEQYLSEGKNLQCCNKFGESILSMACREGSLDVVDFLLNKANVSIQICDDYGKNVLHDACWTSEPDFDLISLLIKKCADLCIVCDKRGHTPLDYVPIDQRESWKSFLLENKDLIQPTVLGERLK